MISLHVLFFFFFFKKKKGRKVKKLFFFIFNFFLSLPLDMPKHKESKRQGEKSSQQMTKA
jgi:hypothetical protein